MAVFVGSIVQRAVLAEGSRGAASVVFLLLLGHLQLESRGDGFWLRAPLCLHLEGSPGG